MNEFVRTEKGGPGCGTMFAAGVVTCVLLVILLGVLGDDGGGGSMNNSRNTEVNVLSNNRVLSPDTNIYVNSQNPQTSNTQTNETQMTGNDNAVTFPAQVDFGGGDVRCWDANANAYMPCGGGQ